VDLLTFINYYSAMAKATLIEVDIGLKDLGKKMRREHQAVLLGESHNSQPVADAIGRIDDGLLPDQYAYEFPPSNKAIAIARNFVNMDGVQLKGIKKAAQRNIPLHFVDSERVDTRHTVALENIYEVKAATIPSDGLPEKMLQNQQTVRLVHAVETLKDYLHHKGLAKDYAFPNIPMPAHVDYQPTRTSPVSGDDISDALHKAFKNALPEDPILRQRLATLEEASEDYDRSFRTGRLAKIDTWVDKKLDVLAEKFHIRGRTKEGDKAMGPNLVRLAKASPHDTLGAQMGAAHNDGVEKILEAASIDTANVKVEPVGDKNLHNRVFRSEGGDKHNHAEWIVTVYDPKLLSDFDQRYTYTTLEMQRAQAQVPTEETRKAIRVNDKNPVDVAPKAIPVERAKLAVDDAHDHPTRPPRTPASVIGGALRNLFSRH
jgi:hypothetical protein